MAVANGTVDGGHHDATSPKIVLYTNHGCPYAHRAHITLTELRLPHDEILIDLDSPRPQWYLDINPRGLVPSIKFTPTPDVHDDAAKEEILTESAVVSEFLAESHPGTLLPAATATDALRRARIRFFIDAFDSKVASFLWQAVFASEGGEREAKLETWMGAVEKELEPLLASAGPFFGGSGKLTFAEVHTGPFVLRWYAIAKDGEMLPSSLVERLDSLPNFSRWAKAVREHASVQAGIWNEQEAVAAIKNKWRKVMAAKQDKEAS